MWGKVLTFAIGAAAGVVGKIIYDENKTALSWGSGDPETVEAQPDETADAVRSNPEESIHANPA